MPQHPNPPPDETVTLDFDRLEDALALLDGALLEANDEDPQFLAALLLDLRNLKHLLAIVYKSAEQALIRSLGDRRNLETGDGLYEVRRSMKRTGWDHDELWRHVVARARDERRVDEATGEYESESEAIARVLFRCARPSWRLTALRDMGLDPDEFCKVEPDALSVQLPARRLT